MSPHLLQMLMTARLDELRRRAQARTLPRVRG